MRSIRWKTTLPVVQFAAYVLLVWYGCWYRPTWQHWYRNWISPRSEDTGWYPTWIDGIEPFQEQVANGLNFPATVLAALTLIPFEDQLPNGAAKNLALHIVTLLYIPLLWYWIGNRLDKLGKTKAPLLSKPGKAITVAGLVVLVLMGVLLLAMLVIGELRTTAGLCLAWVGCGILAAWSRLRHSGSRSGSPSIFR